jgi:hypothetical protein
MKKFLGCVWDCLVAAVGAWVAIGLLAFLIVMAGLLFTASGGTLAGLAGLGAAAITEMMAAAGITAAKLGGAAALGTFIGCVAQC